MTPLLLTSFTERIYRASGVHLLRSYMRHVHDIPLLVFTEGSILGDRLESHPGISTYDLDTSAFLKDWLQANHDIIPEDLGGAAVPCNCPQPDDPFGIHKGGCHWAWFNKNASRWFRKIAALHHAASFPAGFDALVWIDSDCRFLRSVSSQDVEDWFAGVSMFYLKGPERQVIESGVIGFQLNQDGRALIEDVVGRYRSGNFRQIGRAHV